SYEDHRSYETKSYETKIIPCQSAQTYLNQNYPPNGTCQIKRDDNFGKKRAKVEELDISQKGLEGDLDLSAFKNLEELKCSDNCLTNLNVNNCRKLKKIECYSNQLTTLNLSKCKQLEEIHC